MAWWVPLVCFLLASWKEPPAHSAEAEMLKSKAWIWGNPWLFLVTPIFGYPVWRCLVIRPEGHRACPPWEHCSFTAVSKVNCLKLLVHPFGSLFLVSTLCEMAPKQVEPALKVQHGSERVTGSHVKCPELSSCQRRWAWAGTVTPGV